MSLPDPDLIFAYTRAQALAAGVLVDVSAQAGSGPDGMLGGFTCPVAITTALSAAVEAIPPSLVGIADVRGRLHDVLFMAATAFRGNVGRIPMRACGHGFAGSLAFQVILPYRGTRKRVQTLRLHVGPDDDGCRPCVTIGFPEDF